MRDALPRYAFHACSSCMPVSDTSSRLDCPDFSRTLVDWDNRQFARFRHRQTTQVIHDRLPLLDFSQGTLLRRGRVSRFDIELLEFLRRGAELAELKNRRARRREREGLKRLGQQLVEVAARHE